MNAQRSRGVLSLAFLLATAAGPALAQAPGQPAPAADDAPPLDPELQREVEVEELVVTAGAAPTGSVVGDIPPEITLGPREIRALGASSVAELLEALEPQIGSSRGRGGRPVALVNGARISSFREIRDLPPEAILRVDILPEEVALKYGYRADQRVVNFVLRRRFRAITAEAGATVATGGGRESHDLDLNQLQIRGDTRLQLDLKVTQSSPLLESERDLLARGSGAPFSLGGNVTATPFGDEIDPALSALAGQTLTAVGVPAGGGALADFAVTPATTADEAPFRALLSPATSATLNAILSRPLGDGVALTVNGELTASETESWLGLPRTTVVAPATSPFSPFGGDVAVNRIAALDPLTRTADAWSAHLGVSLRGAWSGWNWSFTGNADRADNQSVTERGFDVEALQAAVDAGTVDPFGAVPADFRIYRRLDLAHAIASSADASLLVQGKLGRLPAGEISTAVTVGGEVNRFESDSVRGGVARSADVSRSLGLVRANVDLPIASRRTGVLEAIGNLSLNFNAELNQLSDFGALRTLGGGINWSPVEALRIIASITEEDGPPTIQQLGDPEVATPGVRVFDFVTGDTVEVTQITGGNPDLLADNRRVAKLGLTWKPWSERDFTFRVDWTKARTRDLIASFPAITADIQDAFEGRFVRDAEGRLERVDIRPVNFARQDTEEVRWGFNYSRPFRSARPPGGDGAQRPQGQGGRPQAGGEGAGPRRGPGGGPGGFRGGRGGGFGGGAMQLGLFHTLRLQNEILIAPGGPKLDFLNGAAAGNGGGRPQHQVDLQAGATRNGLGARLTVRWQSGTEVRGASGAPDLIFSDLTRANLRLFADLGQQRFARRNPLWRGARVTLSVDNLFDTRPEVRNALGVTPVNYQPDLLDPLGRTVRLSFRKVFF